MRCTHRTERASGKRLRHCGDTHVEHPRSYHRRPRRGHERAQHRFCRLLECKHHGAAEQEGLKPRVQPCCPRASNLAACDRAARNGGRGRSEAKGRKQHQRVEARRHCQRRSAIVTEPPLHHGRDAPDHSSAQPDLHHLRPGAMQQSCGDRSSLLGNRDVDAKAMLWAVHPPQRHDCRDRARRDRRVGRTSDPDCRDAGRLPSEQQHDVENEVQAVGKQQDEQRRCGLASRAHHGSRLHQDEHRQAAKVADDKVVDGIAPHRALAADAVHTYRRRQRTQDRDHGPSHEHPPETRARKRLRPALFAGPQLLRQHRHGRDRD